MNKAQATADLTMRLARVTTVDNALAIVQRAFRTTGLTNAHTIRESDMNALLQALAAEGGTIQTIAEQLAIEGDGHGPLAA